MAAGFLQAPLRLCRFPNGHVRRDKTVSAFTAQAEPGAGESGRGITIWLSFKASIEISFEIPFRVSFEKIVQEPGRKARGQLKDGYRTGIRTDIRTVIMTVILAVEKNG